jgi:peptidoglycan/xylan/chitin deacetylase (PgdA/CDA1 family)
MYHRFGEDKYPSTNIKIDQFKAQLEVMKNEGFTVVPITDLIAALTKGQSLPPKAVVITIDDAYRSVYEIAYPLFRQYGFPFTVFVATEPVDKGLQAYMSWEQMREMEGNGAHFANHGASHSSAIKNKQGESDKDRRKRIESDIDHGWSRLTAELNPVPGIFAYTYGEYDNSIALLLERKGYICFGQHSGAIGVNSDKRALPRFPIAEAFADIGEFRVKLKSLPMPVVEVQPWEPVTRNDLPEISVTLGRTDARLGQLACYVSGQGRVPVRWIEEGKRFSVGPVSPLSIGRQRVNCTVPLNDGRYLWFSHPWFVFSNKG